MIDAHFMENKQMRKGVVLGMPADEYHAGEEFSKSQLAVAMKAPALLKRQRSGVERVETAAMKRGTAAHAIALEPEVFASEYALPFVPSAGALKTVDDMKAALEARGVEFKASAKKAALEELCRSEGLLLYSDELAAYSEANEGKVILTAEQWQRAHDMGAAILAHPDARKLVTLDGYSEVSFFWTCPRTGLRMRGRWDRLLKIGVAVELKTVGPGMHGCDDFSNAVGRFDYHVQAAIYPDGYLLACLERIPAQLRDFTPPSKFAFLVVAEDACVIDGEAYGVEVYTIDAESVEVGRQEYRAALDVIAQCVRDKRWPGSSGKIQEASLPAWRKRLALEKLNAAA